MSAPSWHLPGVVVISVVVLSVVVLIAPTHNLRYRLGIDRNQGLPKGLRDVRPGDGAHTGIDPVGRLVYTIVAETLSRPAFGAHA